MAQNIRKHKTHVLHFFYDSEDSSALTVLVNDVRFHIMVDPKDLRKCSDKNLCYEYLDKLNGLRDAEQREEDDTEKRQTMDERKREKGSADKDSAVDLTADNTPDEDQDSGSAGVELHNWILSGFADVTETWAPPNREPVQSSLYEWYHGPTYFYSMLVKAGKLDPEAVETTDDLTARIERLVPRMKTPKYVQDMDIPWFNANDLTVQSEVSFPEPAHPGQVIDKKGNVYFFKPVVPEQPGPVKREIQILQKLAEMELDIKVPRIHGFVAYENSKTEIMGLLLTNISSPKPLTKFLKTSVSATKRAEWSVKCEKYVKELHRHKIIWGDAKADNFMADADDELWIIDFGGSYTDGWVDPELSETKEGDEMGLEKVQDALTDPEKNTFDPSPREMGKSGGGETALNSNIKETASGLFVTERKETGGEKRKRDGDNGHNDDEDDGKRAKKGEGDEGYVYA